MSEKPTPPWAKEIPQGSFISYAPTYRVGEYFDRFHKTSYDGLTYYFFDPTEHGYEKGKKYPLLVLRKVSKQSGKIDCGTKWLYLQ